MKGKVGRVILRAALSLWVASVLLLSSVVWARDTATFQFDAAGFLQRINHNSDNNTLSLDSFSPTSGPVGTQVVIHGNAFAATFEGNDVRFNGVKAQITLATTSSLTVTVPAGATTGPISISVGSNTVTSAQNFTVTATTAPSISSFAPISGPVGTRITLTGSLFDPVAANNQVSLNGVMLTVISATTTQLVVEINEAARQAGSGPLVVTTSGGQGTSVGVFTVTSIDEVELGNFTADGSSQSFTVPANKVGLVRMSLPAGTGYLTTFTPTGGVSFGRLTDSAGVVAGLLTSSAASLPQAAIASQGGTYLLRVPGGTTGGAFAMTMTAVPVLSLDTPTASSTLASGQTQRYLFSAVGNTGYGLALTSLSGLGNVNSPNNYLMIYLDAADGHNITYCSYSSIHSCNFFADKVANSGTYIVRFGLRYDNNTIANFTFSLNKDVTGVLPVSDAANPALHTQVKLTQPGQKAQYTFEATVGQNLDLSITDNSVNGKIYVLSPGTPESAVTSAEVFELTLDSQALSSSTPNAFFHLTNLPQSGTYRVLVVPSNIDGGFSQGSLSLQMMQSANGTLAVNGSTAITLNTDQRGFYTFNVSEANRGYGLALSPLNLYTAYGGIKVYLDDPNGKNLGSWDIYAADSINIWSDYLSAPGRYTLRFEQSVVGSSAQFTVNLSTDATGTLTENSDRTVALNARPGQNASLNFSGIIGQNLDLTLSDSSLNGLAIVSVVLPNISIDRLNSRISQNYINSSPAETVIHLPSLPESGAYRVIIDPLHVTQGNINRMRLASVATGTLAVNGSTTLITLGANQRGVYTFDVSEANRGYGLALSPSSLTPANGNIIVYLDGPNGNNISRCYYMSIANNCNFWSDYFNVSGRYTLRFEQSAIGSSAQFTALLSQDKTVTLPLDSALTVSTDRAGQNMSLNFAATAGQNLNLSLTGNTLNGTVYVKLPDSLDSGSSLASRGLSPSSASTSLSLTNLPQSGTYRVLLSPSGASTGGVTVQLTQTGITTPPTQPTANGTLSYDNSLAINVAANQTARYTFSGTAGQYLRLAMTEVSGSASLYVDSPQGTLIQNCGISNNSVCDLGRLPATGTYTLRVGTSNNAYAATLTLSSAVIGSLTLEATSTINVNRVGQSARYSLTGNGRPMTFYANNSTYGDLYVTVYDALGRSISAGRIDGHITDDALLNLSPPANETWTVEVAPAIATTGSVNVVLRNHITGAVAVDGAAINISLLAGQYASYTFSGTAGQYLRLAMPGESGSASLFMDDPQGTSIYYIETSSYSYGGVIRLLKTGTYTLRVRSNNNPFSGVLTLSSEVTGSLTLNATTTIAMNRAGQGATYSFTGNGQPMILYITNNTYGGIMEVSVYNDLGDIIDFEGFSNADINYSILYISPPANKTWTMELDPYYAATGSVNVLLRNQVASVLTVGGAATNISLIARQDERYTFSGTAGQYMRLAATEVSGDAVFDMYDPQGTYYARCNFAYEYSSNKNVCVLRPLPATGTYTLRGSLWSTSDKPFAATLNLTQGLQAPLAKGVAVTTDAKLGQIGIYPLSANAGDALTLQLTNVTPASQVQLWVTDDYDVRLLTCGNIASCDFYAAYGGSYKIWVQPPLGNSRWTLQYQDKR